MMDFEPLFRNDEDDTEDVVQRLRILAKGDFVWPFEFMEFLRARKWSRL